MFVSQYDLLQKSDYLLVNFRYIKNLFLWKMEPITEIRIPLLWNANGFIEVIKEDDISPVEAERVKKLFDDHYSDSEEIASPLSSSSNESHNDVESQDWYIYNKQREVEPLQSDCLRYLPSNEMYENNYENRNIYDNSLDVKGGLKFHACQLCGKRFSRKFNLNTHIKCVHSDEKDYICSFCNRAFNHSSNLRKHIKTVHSSDKPFRCQVCSKSFKHVGAMKGHVRVIHGVRDGL